MVGSRYHRIFYIILFDIIVKVVVFLIAFLVQVSTSHWKQIRTTTFPQKGTAVIFVNHKRITGGLGIPNCKLNYRTIVIKTLWYCHKSRHVDQRHQRPRQKSSHLWSPDFCFFKSQKYALENYRISIKCIWLNCMSACKRMYVDKQLSPYTKLSGSKSST